MNELPLIIYALGIMAVIAVITLIAYWDNVHSKKSSRK
jgi:hypothetical protein